MKRIIAPVIDYGAAPPPPAPPANPAVCEILAGGPHCPCYYGEAEPVIVVPYRCCACMQQAILCMRPVV